MFSEYINKVEAALTRLGIDPTDAKVAEGQYNISKDKSTEVLIDVWEEHDRIFLQVLSPVTKLNDSSRVEVLKMLLEENHGLVEAAFALAKDDIVIKQTMECSDAVNEDKIVSSLSRIAYYSEIYQAKWNS